MEQALELARSQDPNDRTAGIDRLNFFLGSSTNPLSSSDVASLVSVCLGLLNADSQNSRASLGAFQCLASAAVLSPDHIKLHLDGVLPAVVECLGYDKQPVRDAARGLLLTLMEVSSPSVIVERAGSVASLHKSLIVREEFLRIIVSAITVFASGELTLLRTVLPPILQMLNDSTVSSDSFREAVMMRIEEMYVQFGPQFCDELQHHQLPSSLVRDINIRLEKLEPKVCSSDKPVGYTSAEEIKPIDVNQKNISPKENCSGHEMSYYGGQHTFNSGEFDLTEKHVGSVTIYSEKALIREVEMILSTLAPDKDWSNRIAAMQRVEALIAEGAFDYPCFPALLKQLVPLLITQLSDRRSSIVKQACHLISLLSQELLGDFEAFAEMFIPVLLRLVVITILVIAESADTCIKSMLRNCKVSRVLPRLVDCAKNDRSAVLRARCCEYSLLMLECWANAPEIQRSADLYEDLIRCCVVDAMSEVRSNARRCYRMFEKTWPERSRKLFLSFDSVIQRMINDEDRGAHRRYASPSLRERGLKASHKASQTSNLTNLQGNGASATVTMDRTKAVALGSSLSSSVSSSEVKSLRNSTDKSLENMLQPSKHKVTAIQSMLGALDISDKQNFQNQCSTSWDLGIDSSSHDHQSHPSFTASAVGANAVFTDSTASTVRKAFSSSFNYTRKQTSERLEGGLIEDHSEEKVARRSTNTHTDRQHTDAPSKDSGFRDSQGNVIPNFQRPLLRKHASTRVSMNGRSGLDDNQIFLGEMFNNMDGPASLQDALTEGLSPGADWSARVAAFNYVKSLLQQGPKGSQEIVQNFEKVMKLFFQHLDDPHHKVAQAALSALSEIIPSCKKPFEGYLDRILHHIFSRLIDPKELVRQLSLTNLEVVSKTYNIDSLLPALLRALDEQRSPKAKLAVINYAIGSLQKNAISSEGAGNSGILKLWLAKLLPLVYDKNTKLKEAAISCMICVHTNYDSTAVINYILCMSVEDQNSLRRVLRQQTSRIEMDLINFLQNKRERQRPKNIYDQLDVGFSSDGGYVGTLKKTNNSGKHSSGSMGTDSSMKWVAMQESSQNLGSYRQSNEAQEHSCQNLEGECENVLTSSIMDLNYNVTAAGEKLESHVNCADNFDHGKMMDNYLPSTCNVNLSESPNDLGVSGSNARTEAFIEINHSCKNSMASTRYASSLTSRISIPQILHQISNGNESSNVRKQALQQLIEISIATNDSIWNKYFNQIFKILLETLDDSDSSIKEVTLQLVVEMLNKQRDLMEDSIELLVEKLLHVTKDTDCKVSVEAEECLSILLSECDPLRCLNVIVPSFITDDEKTLLTCITSLTKLVSRLSQEELLDHLPSILPVVFDAFGNQSAAVRKSVLFFLVDLYVKLGKAFLPYLEELNCTQLRLVTIYANKYAQARKGTAVDPTHGSQLEAA